MARTSHTERAAGWPRAYVHEEEAAAVTWARHVNDEYAALARDDPDRFAAFVALPQPHVDASLHELARGLDELGVVGATMATEVLGSGLDDPRRDPNYAELDRREAVLFVHPAGLGVPLLTVNGYPPALRLAVQTYGVDRLLFGTDWPFWRGEAHQLAAEYLGTIGLSPDELAQIDSRNAQALFGDRYPLEARHMANPGREARDRKS